MIESEQAAGVITAREMVAGGAQASNLGGGSGHQSESSLTLSSPSSVQCPDPRPRALPAPPPSCRLDAATAAADDDVARCRADGQQAPSPPLDGG